MNQLTTVSQTVTMTSLELVDYINSERDSGGAVLAHGDFLKKVPQVLGAGAGNFSFTYRDAQNKERPCFKFPKREACLMAMSYSYDLQAKVYDKMTALEQATTPRSPAELILAMAQQMVANEQRITGLDNRVAQIEHKQTVAQKYQTVLEFAMGLGLETDKSTLLMMGRKASILSRQMGLEITTKHQDHKGFRGNVNAYHPDVLFAMLEEA